MSFRLTAEEYDRIRERCYANGIRSVSEMARTAIHMLLEQPAPVSDRGLASRIAELETRFEMLCLEVKKLNQDARKIRPAAVAGAANAD